MWIDRLCLQRHLKCKLNHELNIGSLTQVWVPTQVHTIQFRYSLLCSLGLITVPGTYLLFSSVNLLQLPDHMKQHLLNSWTGYIEKNVGSCDQCKYPLSSGCVLSGSYIYCILSSAHQMRIIKMQLLKTSFNVSMTMLVFFLSPIIRRPFFVNYFFMTCIYVSMCKYLLRIWIQIERKLQM